MTEDAELLRRYAAGKSEAAFAEIVRRHLDLVYSVALRQVAGDRHLAEDVAQQVFSDLARKAAALSERATLGGWLYRSTHFAASDVVRAERRRKIREQEALAMNSLTTPSEPVDWDRVRPVLDAAIVELAERDRDALSLRFLDGHSFAEIGRKLRLTENAARMRVERALEKLHGALTRRGVTSTTAAVGIALANQVAAAPVGLAATVTSSALAASASGGAAWLGLLTMSKITSGISGAVVIAIAVTGLVEGRANRELRAGLAELSAQVGDPAALRREGTRLEADLRRQGAANPDVQAFANLQRRAAVLGARPAGVLDAAMKPASQWGNVGRATPRAAMETLHWAMFANEVDAVARFLIFDDDTAENREAFMAHFSAAVRAKYQTPERLLAAAFFGAGGKTTHDPSDAFQMLDVDDHVGGNGSRIGQQRVRVWYSLASGKEFEGSTRWQPTPEGWAVAAFTLAKEWQPALARFDPATGDLLIPPPPP